MGVLVCGLVALLLGSSQPAGRTLPTTIQDDAMLLHGTDVSVKRTISQIAWLGAKYVRVTAGWSVLAPQTTSKRVPHAPFDPSNSSTYVAPQVHALDRVVVDANRAGLGVMIDIGFFAPRWAVPQASPDGRNRYRPDPTLFGDFARAIARRYDGHTPDPSDRRHKLPAVSIYTIWNEPNHAQFLQPQWRHTPDGWIAESPHVYRSMYVSAYAAIKGVDRADQVLIGATSSDGSTQPGQGDVAPLDFVRGVACVNDSMQPLQTPECATYSPLSADGFAHHPYSLRTPPSVPSRARGDVALADLPRLQGLLARLQQAGRITTYWPVYVTEYGYETDPPDPFVRFTPGDQAAFIGWSTFEAWRNPGTAMFAQFLVRDSAPHRGPATSRQSWLSYQTGLYYQDGTPKPAAEAFRLPFWVQRIAGSALVLLFGETRAGPSGRQLVEVEQLSADGTRWTAVHTLTKACDSRGQFLTDSHGFFLTAAAFSGGSWFRLAWRRPDNVWEYGVPVSVAQSEPEEAGPGVNQPGSVFAQSPDRYLTTSVSDIWPGWTLQ